MEFDPFARSVDLWTAFGGGVLAFISPCILPIIPSYMFFISGTSAATLKEDDDEEKQRQKQRVIISSLFFILGFSAVFILLGAAATSLGQVLRDYQDILRRVGGVIIVILGLQMMGVFQIKPLLYEKRIHLKSRPPGYGGAFLIGLTFALGWTPCIGPILGAILAVASTKNSVSEGIQLLSIFSLGMAIPFFITAVLMDRVFVQFRKLQKHMQKISLTSGVFLILIGILIFTNSLPVITNFFIDTFGMTGV